MLYFDLIVEVKVASIIEIIRIIVIIRNIFFDFINNNSNKGCFKYLKLIIYLLIII